MESMHGRNTDTTNRRIALAGIGAGAVAAAVAGRGRSVAAQEGAADPLVGTWMAMTPFGASPETLSADGSFVAGPPAIGLGAAGVQYLGPAIGVWDSTGERTGRFTFVQALGDAAGAYAGTLTIDGHLEASEDGQSFVDDSPETTITIRDAANAVLQVIHPYEPGSTVPPVTGIRMAVGQPGLPDVAATPTP
jgi:hypothetical protein